MTQRRPPPKRLKEQTPQAAGADQHGANGVGDLWAFFLSCLLAFTAGHMFNYTIILYLQEALGSDLMSGLGFGLAFGSSAVFGWFAGVVCDRVPPHRVIHAAQTLFLAGLACVGWAQSGAGDSARILWVLIGAFFGGLGWSFAGPARLTTLAQLARPPALRPATIIFNLQVLLGFGLAPLVIGLVRSRFGWDMVLAIAAVGFVLASLLIAHVQTGTVARTSESSSVVADIGEGFRVVGLDPLLRQLMLATVLAYAMTGPLQILLPKLAKEVLVLTELQRGAYLGLLALSLIVGGVTALALAKRVPHGRVVFGGVVGASLVFAALGLIADAATSAAALACVGVTGGMVISLLVSDIQAHAPAAVRGRVMGMYSIASQVVPALSGVVAGALVHAIGVVHAIEVSGLVLAAGVAVAATRLKAVRRLGPQ